MGTPTLKLYSCRIVSQKTDCNIYLPLIYVDRSNKQTHAQAHAQEHARTPTRTHHLLITGAEATALAHVSQVFLSLLHVGVDLIQALLYSLKLLYERRRMEEEDGGRRSG